MAGLFTELFKDALNEYAYDAELAGLSYDLMNTVCGMVVSESEFAVYCGIIYIRGGQFLWIVRFLLIRGDVVSWMCRFSDLVRKFTVSKFVFGISGCKFMGAYP